MTRPMRYRRAIALAGMFGLLTAGVAVAQMSPLDKSNPAQSGQNTDLKPHPTPPTVTPADKLPVDKIKLPAGFKAEVWSSGHPGGRTMVMGDKGTLFMGTRLIGRVYAITGTDGKREVKTLLSGLTQPNGLAFKDGSLYVFAINKVFRYDNIEDKLGDPGTPVVFTGTATEQCYNGMGIAHGGWAATMDSSGMWPVAAVLGAAFVIGAAIVVGAGELLLVAIARLMMGRPGAR